LPEQPLTPQILAWGRAAVTTAPLGQNLRLWPICDGRLPTLTGQSHPPIADSRVSRQRGAGIHRRSRRTCKRRPTQRTNSIAASLV